MNGIACVTNFLEDDLTAVTLPEHPLYIVLNYIPRAEALLHLYIALSLMLLITEVVES